MTKDRSPLERELVRLSPPRIPFEQLERRRDRKRRDQRIRAAAVGLAVAIGVAWLGVNEFRSTPSVPANEAPPTPSPSPDWEAIPPVGVDWERVPPTDIDWEGVPGVSIDGDAIVDIGTGDVTPLPDTITSLRDPGGYAVAPGGDLLLFVASVDGSSDKQIFVANVDGTDLRQLTDAPGAVTAGGWSPDGTKIVALLGRPPRPNGGDVDLVLIDVATGGTTLLASGPDHDFFLPHFSADGQQVLFSRFRKPQGSNLFGVPVDGGDVGLVFEERWNAIFSPDGRTIVYEVSVLIQTSHVGGFSGWGGQELWLADADATEPRPLVWEHAHSGHASWSPDGTRIAYSRWHPEEDGRIVVVDVASGTPTYSLLTREGLSPDGGGTVWLDGDTLLVDVEGA